MRGIINICKEPGMTSFDVVARLRRLLHEKRIGHGGTLDPLADGVLPVFIGQGTRVSEYMLTHAKRYIAVIRLGYESETYDAEGEKTFIRNPSYVARSDIENALCDFVGTVMQIPPVFSAIKKNGQSLYKAARKGQQIEIEPREVTIYSCDLIEYKDDMVTVDVRCASGTYIRSIAHDLGEKLGCGAYIQKLTRTEYGPFRIENAVTLEKLEEQLSNNESPYLFDIDFILDDFERVDVSDEECRNIIDGKLYAYETASDKLKAYYNNRFFAVLGRNSDGFFHPDKVFKD
jgi:tRNA pseudouridine55 synthase